MLKRLQAWWVWIAVGSVLAAGVGAAAWARAVGPVLRGEVVTPPAPTYDFNLRDQDGRGVRLTAFRGKPVVLTFLYTHCPDSCPLIAWKLRQTHERLGTTARRVALVAVSVDPGGDTPDAVRSFLSAHHLTGNVSYLSGPAAELKRVWAYYYVGSDAQAGTPKTEARSPRPSDVVGHTATVYVIDADGNLRVILPTDFDPEDLAADLKMLARSGR